MKLTLPLDISLDSISGLLSAGFEGGSNYWAQIEEYVSPAKVWHDNGSDKIFPHVDYPLSEGGAVIISDQEDSGKVYRLDLVAIKYGLIAMATHEPRHFADFMAGDYDATTGDVFLQCCAFGEAIYG